ncbi:MAG: methionyl-tRNA formyltransferase [bacterium]|nr:methionyl-tRNA formyltransferase [bacterium]
MRVIFMGTAPFACPTLNILIASPHEVVAVVTQPDRPRGRGRRPAAPAVKSLAVEHCLTVLQPSSLRSSEATKNLAAYRPDVIVVVAYGNILPSAVLELPPYGCINLHGSLLPSYRGPAPINWTLINGETETGYTIIQMDEQVDTGPILWMESCGIEEDDDAVTLGNRLALIGAQGMASVLSGLETGSISPRPQPVQEASHAPKLSRHLGRINWCQDAVVIHNLIRGIVPWPGAATIYQEMEVKVWRTQVYPSLTSEPPGTIVALTPEGLQIACGKQQLLLRELQPANRRRITAREFAHGYRVQAGDHFV